jgi:hypothetical protein
LDSVIPLGERHLRQLVSDFAAHYHTERNHQALGNKHSADPCVAHHSVETLDLAPASEQQVAAS